MIHRAWDIEARTNLMFDDRIEIVFQVVAIWNNRRGIFSWEIICFTQKSCKYIFIGWGLLEIFGTGVMRIKQLYEDGIQ